MAAEKYQPLAPWTQLHRSLRTRIVGWIRRFRCSAGCMKNQIVSAFPILDWLLNYKIRSCLMGDVISGCTVGILNIPQGMAYGVLSGVEPINGLYASFFPVLIYSCLCTSQHASVGTFAVTSLMTGGIVHTVGAEMIAHRNHTETPVDNGTATFDKMPLDIRLQVTIAVTLAVGLWQVLMGVFRLGYLAVFLSDHLVKGFTCAAAFHVFTSQVKLVFGIQGLEERYGPLKLVYFYIDFFSKISQTHVPTLIVSLICITILYLTRVLVNQNPRVMKIIRVPFPIELLVIIFGTLASYELDLESEWGVKTVQNVPTGLPAPVLPHYSIIPEILGRTFSLAIVASAVLISLAKIFATKHNYKIDANQELIAIGASNIFGSFFLCIPATGALARSAVQESVGGSTQMVSLVSAVIVLIVLVALGRFLQPLPKACLGAIIMVALINMLKGALEVRNLWKVSLIDASIFMVTLLATLLLDVDYGLAIGVLYSLLVFAFRMQYGRVAVLGRVRGTLDEIKPLEDPMVDEVSGIKIFRLHGPLYSGNAESFVAKIRKAMISNVRVVSSYLSPVPELEATEMDETMTSGQQPSSGNNQTEITVVTRRQDQATDAVINIVQNNSLLTKAGPRQAKPLRAIIIDCSAINFIDVVGTEKLLRLVNECNKKGIRVVFAACSDSVRDILYLSGVAAALPEENFMSSVSDAIDEL